jgi:hypothetical protein
VPGVTVTTDDIYSSSSLTMTYFDIPPLNITAGVEIGGIWWPRSFKAKSTMKAIRDNTIAKMF